MIIYFFLRWYKYLTEKPKLSYEDKELIRASMRAVQYKTNIFVKWFYPRLIEAWVKVQAFDNAYHYFWKRTQKEFFKKMIKDKAPNYREFWKGKK